MSVQLTADDLTRLKAKELANTIRKLHEGKTLTAAERALLASSAASSPSAPASGYAKNWADLGTALGVTRRAIQDWRNDPRYQPHIPKARPDGRHDIAAWAAFMVSHGLKRADEHIGDTAPTDDESATATDFPSGSEAQWKKKLLQQKVIKAEIENGVTAGSLLVAAELAIPLGATFVAIQNKLTSFPERIAPQVAGFTDVPEITAILRAEIEANLSDLHGADYLDPIPAIADALNIPAELREHVTTLAAEVLRRIGQHVITPAAPASEPPPATPKIADEPAPEPAPAQPKKSKRTAKKTRRPKA